MNPDGRPIRRRKLYEEVSSRIERMIYEGTYAPGEELPSEHEIMERFDVGRSAVREAMLSLQKMGLVTVRSGQRARVTAPTADVLLRELGGSARHLLAQDQGIEQFQEARALFEIGLARRAAQVATPEDIAQLKFALDQNFASLGDVEIFMRSDVAFHFAISEIPRNSIFTAVHQAVVGWLTEQRATSLRAHGAQEHAFAAHQRILTTQLQPTTPSRRRL